MLHPPQACTRKAFYKGGSSGGPDRVQVVCCSALNPPRNLQLKSTEPQRAEDDGRQHFHMTTCERPLVIPNNTSLRPASEQSARSFFCQGRASPQDVVYQPLRERERPLIPRPGRRQPPQTGVNGLKFWQRPVFVCHLKG